MMIVMFTAASLQAQDACRPEQLGVVDAEARCVDKGGIAIGFVGDAGAKGACMANDQVQAACGRDGQGTRRLAFAQWLGHLKEFERHCMEEGGSFAFKDRSFSEPSDETFCLQAQPEIGSNMFEEPLCNYRSLCPAVTVVCSFSCGGGDILSNI